MDLSSHNSRRKPRPWTAQEQVTAEVAAACGVSLREVARVLGRTCNVVANHLCTDVAEKNRNRARAWREANPDQSKESARRWYHANVERGRESRRLYRNANLDRTRNRDRKWRDANCDRLRDYLRRYRESNADKIRERDRRYYAANAEKSRQYSREYRDANASQVRETLRRWREHNRDKIRHNSRCRNALQRAARRHALYPVTRQQIDTRFALWSNRCAFCGVDASHQRNHGRDRLAVEHVLALTKGGLDEASNIIPACTSCNSSKNNSPVEAWYRRQPFFSELRWWKIQRHCPAAVVGQLPLAL